MWPSWNNWKPSKLKKRKRSGRPSKTRDLVNRPGRQRACTSISYSPLCSRRRSANTLICGALRWDEMKVSKLYCRGRSSIKWVSSRRPMKSTKIRLFSRSLRTIIYRRKLSILKVYISWWTMNLMTDLIMKIKWIEIPKTPRKCQKMCKTCYLMSKSTISRLTKKSPWPWIHRPMTPYLRWPRDTVTQTGSRSSSPQGQLVQH
jgi:hypothetical protein